MEDPVVLAILGVIAVIIMATILRTIVNKILARRQNTRKSCSVRLLYYVKSSVRSINPCFLLQNLVYCFVGTTKTVLSI